MLMGWFILFTSIMTIRKRIAKIIYKWLATDIKQLQTELGKVEWKEKCDFAFAMGGHNYYKFKSSSDIPLVRLEQIQVNVILLENRLTKNELRLLLSIAESSLNKCIEVAKMENKIQNLTHAMWAIEEIKGRADVLMFHPEILCDLAAYTLIREDENPFVINEEIHKSKVGMFNKEGGDNPFFVEAGLGVYLPNSKELIAGLKQSWELHTEQVKRSNKTYESIRSEIESISM